jgi:hypothetical protein
VLSVNLSVTTLGSPGLWEALPDDLSEVIVEITEDELFGVGEELERALARLHDMGARIALDDAGAGYAGLQQLMRVRPDIVKLDRPLVSGVAHDPRRAALVSSFATQTGGAVCAEGLQDPADFDSVPRDLTTSLGGSVPERLASIIATAASADRVDLWRLDRRAGDLVAVRAPDRDPGARVALGDVPARAHALATGEAGQILRTDVDADRTERRAMASAGYHGVLLVPLEAGGAILGLVACYRRRARPWSRESVARVHARALPLASVLSGGGLTVAEGA